MDKIEQALESLIKEHGSPNTFYTSEVGELCGMIPQRLGKEMKRRSLWIDIPSLRCFARYYTPGEVRKRYPACFLTFGDF